MSFMKPAFSRLFALVRVCLNNAWPRPLLTEGLP